MEGVVQKWGVELFLTIEQIEVNSFLFDQELRNDDVRGPEQYYNGKAFAMQVADPGLTRVLFPASHKSARSNF